MTHPRLHSYWMIGASLGAWMLIANSAWALSSPAPVDGALDQAVMRAVEEPPPNLLPQEQQPTNEEAEQAQSHDSKSPLTRQDRTSRAERAPGHPRHETPHHHHRHH